MGACQPRQGALPMPPREETLDANPEAGLMRRVSILEAQLLSLGEAHNLLVDAVMQHIHNDTRHYAPPVPAAPHA